MLVHGTWMKNLKSILSEGLRPGGGQNKGRLRHEDSDGGVVHAVRSRSKAAEAHDHGSKYAEAWGRPPEVKLYIDPKRIDPAGLFSSNSRASGDDPDHFLIKGRIPASAIVHVEVNVPAEVPPQLRAGVGNPLNFQSVPVVSLGLPDGCFSGDTGGVPASSRKQEDLVREVGAACRGPYRCRWRPQPNPSSRPVSPRPRPAPRPRAPRAWSWPFRARAWPPTPRSRHRKAERSPRR